MRAFPACVNSGTAARLVVVPVLFSVLIVLTGCATYSSKFSDLKPELANGEFEAALQTVEDEAGDKERLLYFLERGSRPELERSVLLLDSAIEHDAELPSAHAGLARAGYLKSRSGRQRDRLDSRRPIPSP